MAQLPAAPPGWLPPVPTDPRGRYVSWAAVIWEGPLVYWDLGLEDWAEVETDLAWIEGQVEAYQALLQECPEDPHPILRRHNDSSGEREGDILALAAAWDPERGANCLIAALAWADPDAAVKIARGQLRNISAGIGGLITNRGTIFEEILLEISIVAAGHIRGARVLHARGTNVDPKNPKDPKTAAAPATPAPPVAEPPAPAPVDPASIRAAVASALGELLPDMLRQLGVAAPKPAAAEEEPDSEMGKRMAAQQREIDALKREALDAKKAAFSAAYPKDAALDLSAEPVKAALEQLYLEQPEVFAKLEGHIKRPGATATKPAPESPRPNPFGRLGAVEDTSAAPGMVTKMSASQLNAECLEAAKGDHKAARLLFRQKLKDYKSRGVEIDTTA